MPATIEDPGPAAKKILIVDDHPVLRRGLAALIEAAPDLAVCGEAESYSSALSVIEKDQPDLVTVDISLEGSNGLDLIKEMKRNYPAIPALVLSMYDEPLYAERALKAGALGYVNKKKLNDTLLVAVRRVLDGETYMSEELKSSLAGRFVQGQTLETDKPLHDLSDRELQVFELIGHGQSTRQVATTMNLSIKTIESHVEHIKRKLALKSYSELTHRAIQWIESGRTP